MKPVLFLSCEHGGNEVPPALRKWFTGAGKVLSSHRGFDIGALDLFAHLRPLSAASISNQLSRLCIEYNRAEDGKHLYSEYTRELPAGLKALLMEGHRNYREGFRSEISKAIEEGEPVVHVSVHSFTPHLNDRTRTADIGLLFDPRRKEEAAFCNAWRNAIKLRAPGLRVRVNYPYKGTSDGFTTALRTKLRGKDYLGIELEVNQAFAAKRMMDPDIKSVLYASLREVIGL